MSTLTPPPEAEEHLQRAFSIQAGEDDAGWTEKAAECALAIKKANGLFPDAHALLGICLDILGDEKKARQELNIAIQQDNYNCQARAYLILMDINKLGMPDRLQPSGASLVLDVLKLGIGSGIARSKVSALSGQVDALVEAYPKDISGTDVEYWLYISGLLLDVHDALQDIKGMPQKGRLARAVTNASWETVPIPPEYEQAVNKLRRRAEGRALLAK